MDGGLDTRENGVGILDDDDGGSQLLDDGEGEPATADVTPEIRDGAVEISSSLGA